jgi:hypothetical protein
MSERKDFDHASVKVKTERGEDVKSLKMNFDQWFEYYCAFHRRRMSTSAVVSTISTQISTCDGSAGFRKCSTCSSVSDFTISNIGTALTGSHTRVPPDK